MKLHAKSCACTFCAAAALGITTVGAGPHVPFDEQLSWSLCVAGDVANRCSDERAKRVVKTDYGAVQQNTGPAGGDTGVKTGHNHYAEQRHNYTDTGSIFLDT